MRRSPHQLAQSDQYPGTPARRQCDRTVGMSVLPFDGRFSRRWLRPQQCRQERERAGAPAVKLALGGLRERRHSARRVRQGRTIRSRGDWQCPWPCCHGTPAAVTGCQRSPTRASRGAPRPRWLLSSRPGTVNRAQERSPRAMCRAASRAASLSEPSAPRRRSKRPVLSVYRSSASMTHS